MNYAALIVALLFMITLSLSDAAGHYVAVKQLTEQRSYSYVERLAVLIGILFVYVLVGVIAYLIALIIL